MLARGMVFEDGHITHISAFRWVSGEAGCVRTVITNKQSDRHNKE